MSIAFYDRVKFSISNTPGTGSGFTVNAAVSGFRTPAGASIPNSTELRLLITEGTAWEVCDSAYTSGTTSLSRGTLRASSTGSAVNFTSAAVVGVIASAADFSAMLKNLNYSLLATLDCATGTPASVAVTDLDVNDLLVVVSGVSHNSGSNQTFAIGVDTDNGASYTSNGTGYTGNFSASSVGYGVIHATGLKQGNVMFHAHISAASTPEAAINATASLGLQGVFLCSAQINAVRFAFSGGNFDAGTIYVYGR